jgi:hypothetical protein
VRSGLSEVQTSLLSMVPFRMLPALPARIFDPDRNTSGTGIPELAAALARLDVERPFFLYAHILSPHVPFRNDAACNVVPARPVTRAAFVDQVRCVNRQLLALVDGIHRDDPDAIVLLVADHGPRLGSALTPLADLTPAQIRESLGVLNALRLPDGCRVRVPGLLSPVNDMRIVFACIGDHPPRPLAREHFVVPHGPGHPEFGRIRRVTDVLPGPRRVADPLPRD